MTIDYDYEKQKAGEQYHKDMIDLQNKYKKKLMDIGKIQSEYVKNQKTKAMQKERQRRGHKV